MKDEYIVSEEAIFNQVLDSLRTSRNTDKILSTFECIKDKAPVASENQKDYEVFVINDIIRHNTDNERVLEQSFNTLVRLCSVDCHNDDIFNSVYNMVTKLEEDIPALTKYIEPCIKDLDLLRGDCDKKRRDKMTQQKDKTMYKYGAYDSAFFDQMLASLRTSHNTDKILSTLEYIEDKALIEGGGQKSYEASVIGDIIRHNMDNDKVIEKSFNTLEKLCTKGSTKWYPDGNEYDLVDDIYKIIDELGDIPALKKYAKACNKKIALADIPTESDVEKMLKAKEDMAYEKAYMHYEIEYKKEKIADRITENQIRTYEKSRKGRRKTALDEVVEARLAAKKTVR